MTCFLKKSTISSMKGIQKILLISMIIFLVSCYVDLDLRTPDSTLDTFKSVATIKNLKEFRMMSDEKHYYPTDDEAKRIMDVFASGYIKVIRTDFELDDELGNMNTLNLLLTVKGTGEKKIIKFTVRDIEDLWYIHNIEFEKEEK